MRSGRWKHHRRLQLSCVESFCGDRYVPMTVRYFSHPICLAHLPGLLGVPCESPWQADFRLVIQSRRQCRLRFQPPAVRRSRHESSPSPVNPGLDRSPFRNALLCKGLMVGRIRRSGVFQRFANEIARM